MYGLPVSTTHVLSSGIAGTMSANGSGLQLSTVRNIALAWVFTLPAAMVISGTLYSASHDILGRLRKSSSRYCLILFRGAGSPGALSFAELSLTPRLVTSI